MNRALNEDLQGEISDLIRDSTYPEVAPTIRAIGDHNVTYVILNGFVIIDGSAVSKLNGNGGGNL